MADLASVSIRELDEYITVFDIPFSRFGRIPIGNRSTAIRLSNGRVLVVVSSPLDQVTRNKLAEMGMVSHLIAPDLEHTMRIQDFHKAYPDAIVIGPAGVSLSKPGVGWTGIMGEGGENATYGFEDEIKLHYFSGHANKEIAILHVPTRTLIQADLIFAPGLSEQYITCPTKIEASWPLSIWQKKLFRADENSMKITFRDKASVGPRTAIKCD